MSDTTKPQQPPSQPNNPLHGIKLADIVTQLVDHFGWQELAQRIDIRCFHNNPSVKSSLTFLRRTPWAREKVEQLYLKAKLYQQVTRSEPAATAPVVKPKAKAKAKHITTDNSAEPAPAPAPATQESSDEKNPVEQNNKPRRFAGSKNPKRSF